MSTCTGQPVSWLELERYHLGDLPSEAQQTVSSHLQECSVCRQCLDDIRAHSARLPALPVVMQPERPRPRLLQLLRVGLPGAFALAAAIAIVWIVIPRQDVLPPTPPDRQATGIPAQHTTYKGGDLALYLVRERDGDIVEAAEGYADGDRFKIQLTCPGPMTLDWEAVLFQGGETYLPYARHPRIRCGNRVPLPGAFRLLGTQPVIVCVTVGEGLPDLDQVTSPDELPVEGTVCTTLEALQRP